MKAEEAEARYEMTLERENGKYYAVKVHPKLQEDKESFKKARSTWRRSTCCRRGSRCSPRTARAARTFGSSRRPERVGRRPCFQGRPLKGWKVIRNPDAQGQPRGMRGEAAPGRPARA